MVLKIDVKGGAYREILSFSWWYTSKVGSGIIFWAGIIDTELAPREILMMSKLPFLLMISWGSIFRHDLTKLAFKQNVVFILDSASDHAVIVIIEYIAKLGFKNSSIYGVACIITSQDVNPTENF